jgi:hypothetical protein
MNIKNLLATVLLLLILPGGYQRVFATQLSGTYTIDVAGTATSTSFLNVSSAISYLTGVGTRTDGGPANLAPFGVSGPVVFLIAPGTYVEQVTLKGMIDGASSVNTVSFEGTDPATRMISFAATASALRHTLKLDSTKYVSFRNVTIVASGATYGWAVHITNANCNANKITHCTINITGTGAASTSANYCGIVVSGSATSATTGVSLDSLEIDSNTINAGFYGIISSGVSAYYQKANKIRYNKVYSSYSYGIYTTYQDGVTISDNTLILRAGSASSNGILVMNSNSSVTATGNKVSRNKVSNFGIYGIRISTVLNSYAGTKGEISNNMIGGGVTGAASFPLNISSSNNWNVCNNTVNHDVAATAVTNAALNITGGLNLNVYNNIFAETRGGSGLPLYVSTLTAIDTIDYNIFYRSDTSNGQLLYIGGLYYNTGNFKRSGIADSNSVFIKPVFVNDTNLHLFNSCNRGTSLSYITTDIDGTLRGTPPVIGAHEAQSIADNIAIAGIVSPVHPIDTGTQDLVVRIRNVGSTTVTGFNISYTHNSGTLVTQAWTGMLAACDTVSVVLTGSNSITLGIANYLKVYTSLPNGVTDGNRIDDTVSVKYYYVLNGTYTVGGTGADFISLTDARDALQQRGVAGPVTFMLNPGTYTGQLIISGQIAGASAINTITFEGTDAATRTITASVASGTTVILNQCSYVHFRNITISNTYAGSCTGFAFVGSNLNIYGSNNSIKHCVINMPNLNTASSNGIAVTGSANGFSTSNNRMDSIVIDSNTINGANTGISVYGNSGATNNYNREFKVRGNTITCTDAQSDRGIFINYIYNGTEANFNTVTATDGIGIYFATCGNNFTGNSSHQLIMNRLNIGNGGIQMDQCLSSLSNPTKIYNNQIFVHSVLIATGIYIYAGGVDEVYHNTIQIDSTSSLFLGMCFNYDGSADSKVKNNIFAHSGTGTGTVYPVYIANGIAGDNLNYNVYYNAAGPDLVFRNGTAYGNANLLTDSTGGDSSYNIKPAFANNSDLHLTTGCPRGVDLTTWVTADFDNLPRSTSPSIGCYEFGGYANDVEVQAITSPVIPVAVGAQDLRILLANKGNNAITALNISYVLNGGAPVTQAWSGMLPACDTVSIVFTGANQPLIANMVNILKVYTSMPNFTADGNPLNDTITKQIAPALNGNYVIGAAPSDFATFTDAADALAQRGVSGRVLFDVRTATYAEAFTLPAIAGASAANTITFQSMAGHRDSVSLTFASAGTSVVNLQNASYVNLKNLSINQLANADYYSALLIGGTASYDSIENCELTVPPFVSNFTMALYTSALTGTGMVIRNNYVSGGYGGIMINILDAFLNPNIATSNHVIENNIIENANYYSSFNFRVTNLTLRNNTIIPDPSNTGHTGIHLESCDSAILVSGNKIIGQTGGFGMYINACTGSAGTGGVLSNNEISIGTNTAAEGIHVIVSAGLRFYNNSINVISSATVNTAAAYFSGSTDFIIRNNIFSNTGGGPALYVNAPYDFDYNNLYTTGTNLAKYNTTNYTSLASWRTAVNTPDLHSVSYRPGFTSPTNLEPAAADSASWSLNGRGIHLAANPMDIDNNARPLTAADGLPDLGAYEFTPTALPPSAVPDIALPVPGDTQVFVSVFSPKDTVATIYWDATNPFFPTTIAVRQYVGEKPPTIGTAPYYMYFYTDMDCEATGFYNYSIDVKYKDLWLGTMPNEADMRIARKITDGPWVVDVSSNSQIDTAVNIMKTLYQSDSSAMFTGSDIFSPLPVKLLTISANKSGRNALISWTTASEANSNAFEIERSYDGKTFKPVGKVKAAGSSQSNINYQYTDLNPSFDLQFTKPIYYRLKMVDANAAYAYSQTVKVSWSNETKEQVAVFPNPFASEVFVSVETASATDVKVEWMDITGRTLTGTNYKVSGGTTMLDVLPEATLKAGIYFVSIDMNGSKQVYKVIKE